MNPCCSSNSTLILLDSRPSFNFNKHSLLNSPSAFRIQHKPNFNFNNNAKICCRAVFSDDAPFAAAIGACMLTSLVFPVPVATEEEEESAVTSTDARLAVMGIISFIPYFNWLVSKILLLRSFSHFRIHIQSFLIKSLNIYLFIELGFCVA